MSRQIKVEFQPIDGVPRHFEVIAAPDVHREFTVGEVIGLKDANIISMKEARILLGLVKIDGEVGELIPAAKDASERNDRFRIVILPEGTHVGPDEFARACLVIAGGELVKCSIGPPFSTKLVYGP